MRGVIVTMLLLAAGCAHRGVVGVEPPEVEDAALAARLEQQGQRVSVFWHVPGAPGVMLALITRDAEGEAYGPQLVAIDAARAATLHESPRLYDADFVHPRFFRFDDRTLMLADHGNEDAYGVLAWSFEQGRIRDLGELPIALPGDVFTSGAAEAARAELRDGRYVVSVDGPVLLHPLERREQRFRAMRFEERDGKLVMARR